MEKKRVKEIFLYLLFGVMTTAVNIAVYSFLYYKTGTENVPAVIAAWVASVLFAYVTNRIWVFESKNGSILTEAAKFFGGRAFTGVLDLAVMYAAVDVLKMDGGIIKIVSNILVIVLNYVLSRLWIFND